MRAAPIPIALDAFADTYLQIALATGISPALMHRIAVIGSGTLDSLPPNGAIVTLLAVCGSTHRKSYFDVVMANIVGPVIALAVVIFLGSTLGSF
jgi:H+/gluconate symporter-like permease